MVDHATKSEEQLTCPKHFVNCLQELTTSKNSKLRGMQEGLTFALVFQACCHVLERIPPALTFQNWHQEHLSLSFTVLLYHMQAD